MTVLFAFAIVLLAGPALVRALRRRGGADAPARLLGFAVGALPDSHRDWGRAMVAELATVSGAGPRWRFSLGCLWAAGVIRARVALRSREPGGAGLRALIGTSLVAALALGGYGLVRYPHLGSRRDEALVAAGFVALLLAYGWLTLALSRGSEPRASAGRRYGVPGGAIIAVAWLLVLSPTEHLKQWVLIPLLIALLGPVVVAALAARAGRDADAGSRAALWTGIVGGLLVFTVWMTATYVRGGRPYDPQLVRDFHHSGAPDLATLAVTDHLTSALALLVLIPLTALAFGSLVARLPAAESFIQIACAGLSTRNCYAVAHCGRLRTGPAQRHREGHRRRGGGHAGDLDRPRAPRGGHRATPGTPGTEAVRCRLRRTRPARRSRRGTRSERPDRRVGLRQRPDQRRLLMPVSLLLDTSVFIAAETGRPLQRRPEGETRVSVVTLAELRLGVLRAEGAVRQLRESTLGSARRFVPIPVDEYVADELSALLAKLRASQRRAKAFDCFIAATALAHDLTVVAQDTDFEELEAAEPRLSVTLV